MKTCGKCKVNKELIEFSKHPKGKFGVQSYCNSCCKTYRQDNKEKRKLLNKKWQTINSDHFKFYNKQYKKTNEVNVKSGKKIWQQINAGKMRNHVNTRNALKLNATLNGPNNKFKNQIEAIYRLVGTLQKITGIKYEVHHIYPLKEFSCLFSGLHVPWNLRVLTKEQHNEAHRKLNDYFLSSPSSSTLAPSFL
jgi:hypothetical protein